MVEGVARLSTRGTDRGPGTACESGSRSPLHDSALQRGAMASVTGIRLSIPRPRHHAREVTITVTVQHRAHGRHAARANAQCPAHRPPHPF